MSVVTPTQVLNPVGQSVHHDEQIPFISIDEIGCRTVSLLFDPPVPPRPLVQIDRYSPRRILLQRILAERIL